MEHSSKANKFFTKEENQRIEQTTRDVESRTIGEIVVMVVDSSDQYVEADMMFGVLIGSLISLIITVEYLHSSVWFYIPISLLFFFPAKYLLSKIPVFKSAFIGFSRKNHAVRDMALRAFYEKGLYKTKQNTGILFFISLLERKVWVIADKGIHEKMKQETLNNFARTVSLGIREGHSCDALCEAIKEAGKLLEKYFPVTPDDTDELTNKVITESNK